MDDEAEVAENVGLGDDSMEERRAAKKGFFPSSMGPSFLVGEGVESLEVAVRWGDYRRIGAEGGDAGRDRDEGEAGDPNRDRGVGEEGAGSGHEGQGESGGETGEEIGEVAPAAGHADQGRGSGVRAWWQRALREEMVSLTLPASMDSPDTVLLRLLPRQVHPVPREAGDVAVVNMCSGHARSLAPSLRGHAAAPRDHGCGRRNFSPVD